MSSKIEIVEDPIDLNAVLSAVEDDACGAQVLFTGTTRRWTTLLGSEGERVVETERLHYDAYREMALKQLQTLADAAQSRWPCKRIVIVHRLGTVLPGEPSVAVAVATPHRSEAFEAAKWLIDTLKHEVPIWKREHYMQSDGPESEWIHPTGGSCRCSEASRPQQDHADHSKQQQQCQQ